jgi:hypothetical protein
MPATGYPISFRLVAVLASLMTAAGVTLVIRNKKEKE